MDARFSILLLCFLSVQGLEDKTITEYITDSSNHIFLRNLILQAGLETTLSEDGPFTFFAPTDQAFMDLGDALDGYTLLQLKSILEYHLHSGYLLVSSVSRKTNYTTYLGDKLLVEPSDNGLLLNNISTVAKSSGDIILNNGVIQMVDIVLMPPNNIMTNLDMAQVLLIDDERFKDIVLALFVADLITLLESRNGEFTLFAPVDSAFLKHMERILNPIGPNAKEVYDAVIKLHIVRGVIRFSDLENGQLDTLRGETLNIQTNGTFATVNGANITETNIWASNGVIHVIDDLLLPEGIKEIAGIDYDYDYGMPGGPP